MTKRDWLLMFFALKGSPNGVDPVRIQKGMFLFAMESGLEGDDVYTFRPYNYGPMSSDIYSDLDSLQTDGLVAGERVAGASWRRYRATEKGLERAVSLRDVDADRGLVLQLFQIKQDVMSKTFNSLLTDVYDRYPAYATRSVFQRS